MQRRLQKANIFTYAQLAESKPEELRRALGEVGSLASVEDWIEQARERVRAV
jgi:predicted flap endonuclease-1-like 5' DNA nuclease